MKYKCHFPNQHQKLYQICKAQANTFSNFLWFWLNLTNLLMPCVCCCCCCWWWNLLSTYLLSSGILSKVQKSLLPPCFLVIVVSPKLASQLRLCELACILYAQFIDLFKQRVTFLLWDNHNNTHCQISTKIIKKFQVYFFSSNWFTNTILKVYGEKMNKIGQKYKKLIFGPLCKSSHAMDHCKIMAQLYYKKA